MVLQKKGRIAAGTLYVYTITRIHYKALNEQIQTTQTLTLQRQSHLTKTLPSFKRTVALILP